MKNSTQFCHKNLCVKVEGESAKTINSILTFGVILLVAAAVAKAIAE